MFHNVGAIHLLWCIHCGQKRHPFHHMTVVPTIKCWPTAIISGAQYIPLIATLQLLLFPLHLRTAAILKP